MSRKPDYLDDLVLELRLLDVPGDRIGQILAEHESHLAESGEAPEDAFGPVREYARELAAREGRTLPPQASSNSALAQFFASMRARDWLMAVAGLAITFLGASLVFDGAFALARGTTSRFGLPALLVLAVGAVCLLSWLWWLRALNDPIVDPRTGDEVRFNRRGGRADRTSE